MKSSVLRVFSPRFVLRTVSRSGRWFALGLGALTALVLMLSPLFVIYPTLHYEGESGTIAIKTRGWIWKSTRPVEGFIDTALVRLQWRSADLTRFDAGVSSAEGTIAVDPSRPRVMLADRTGTFFEVDLHGDGVSVRRLPFSISLNEDKLLEYAAGRGVVSNALLRVVGLVLLTGGDQLAAAYTQWQPDRRCVTLNVALRALSEDWHSVSADAWRVVYESQPCLPVHVDGTRLFAGHQAGGRLVEKEKGTLVLAVGDFEYDDVNRKPGYPQDSTVDYGKIFEIDTEKPTKRVVSVGHRNPQGLSQDRTGRLWETEHGPQGGDELNLVQPGKNYGWPLVTLGTNYDTFKWPLSSAQGRHDGFDPPALAWVPSVGVSNLIEVSQALPVWSGDLLVASMAGQSLFRVRPDGDRVVFAERIQLGARARDLGQLADGRVVVWTDDGRFFTLTPTRDANSVEDRLAPLSSDVKTTIESCLQCHTISGDNQTNGKISLRGINGRRVASGQVAYSEALSALGGNWNEKRLDEFLADPEKRVPGTFMIVRGIHDERIRREVVQFLLKTN